MNENIEKVELTLDYHPDDLAHAQLAATVSNIELKDFVRLATHEKAREVVRGGGSIATALLQHELKGSRQFG